jgi:anti-sigma B factor antagonist
MLNTTFSNENGVLTLGLDGRLDVLTSQTLEKELEAVLEDATEIIVDFEKLEYISSAGLRTLLAAEQYMQENGREKVKVINANEDLYEILDETGFTKILDVVQ